MKQFVPYAKFLERAYKVKHDPTRHRETLPATEQVRLRPLGPLDARLLSTALRLPSPSG